MTEAELNKLHYINKEIGVLKRQLSELEQSSYVKGQEISDMPHASGTSNKTCDRAVAILEIQELYEIKLKELFITRAKIERYIENIENDKERLIIRLRCINNMNWEDIGEEIGYHRTRVSQIYRGHFKNRREVV